jgi:hypothetical protein
MKLIYFHIGAKTSRYGPAMCTGNTQWRDELSNSGDTLKLLIPSSNRKVICGWTNYSGKVTSQEMIENEMGNRGSKSSSSIYIEKCSLGKGVKEQRVDGSYLWRHPLLWRGFRNPKLRCALMGCESSYQIKNPSKQINKLLYSTSCLNNTPKARGRIKLSPWFITGFSDAEACFTILIQENNKYKLNWRVKPIFTIGLHPKDIDILKDIQYTLGVGTVRGSSPEGVVIYSVESIQDLEIIINHFNNYPLVTAKFNDFIIFKQCFEFIKKGEHLTEKGLLKIINLKSSLNLGNPENIIKAFPDLVKGKKAEFIFKGIPNPFWISGFTYRKAKGMVLLILKLVPLQQLL